MEDIIRNIYKIHIKGRWHGHDCYCYGTMHNCINEVRFNQQENLLPVGRIESVESNAWPTGKINELLMPSYIRFRDKITIR